VTCYHTIKNQETVEIHPLLHVTAPMPEQFSVAIGGVQPREVRSLMQAMTHLRTCDQRTGKHYRAGGREAEEEVQWDQNNPGWTASYLASVIFHEFTTTNKGDTLQMLPAYNLALITSANAAISENWPLIGALSSLGRHSEVTPVKTLHAEYCRWIDSAVIYIEPVFHMLPNCENKTAFLYQPSGLHKDRNTVFQEISASKNGAPYIGKEVRGMNLLGKAWLALRARYINDNMVTVGSGRLIGATECMINTGLEPLLTNPWRYSTQHSRDKKAKLYKHHMMRQLQEDKEGARKYLHDILNLAPIHIRVTEPRHYEDAWALKALLDIVLCARENKVFTHRAVHSLESITGVL